MAAAEIRITLFIYKKRINGLICYLFNKKKKEAMVIFYVPKKASQHFGFRSNLMQVTFAKHMINAT
jgi:hypothetical protein